VSRRQPDPGPLPDPLDRSLLLPAWIQGRNINLRYHEHHVQELDDLGRTMGCTVCITYGRRWLDVAPGEWRRLASLG
jgi:hypothetical protein